MQSTLTLSTEDASEMRWMNSGDPADGWAFPWKEISDDITDTGRWHVHRDKVIHKLDDDTYWLFRYSLGATEYQEHEDPDPELTRVYPVEVTKIEYRTTPPEAQPA